MKFSGIALLGAATLAVAEHNHLHRHPARHGSPLEVRDAATTTTVAGPTVTVYELNGAVVKWEDVEAGMKNGKYVLVGDSLTSVTQPSTTSTSSTSTSSPKPVPTTSSAPAAVFIEKKPSTSATPTSTYVAPTTSAKPAPPPAAATSAAPKASVADAASDSSSSNHGSGLTKEFPSGKIDCDDFASVAQYGPVAAPWVKLGGWTGVQHTPSYSIGAAAISDIETLVPGMSSNKGNSFYSYACPPGYQKSQWPEAQGATGQSIGGLYCNSQGKLELSRDSYKTLCQKGVGNVKAKNSLSKLVSICRTDYPGTESETIATVVQPGGTVDITNPDANTYYQWDGKSTSAQYYINPSGAGPDQACWWNNPGSNLGNFAPVNMGVGKGPTGETFISIFPNHPSNMDGVLDFSIKITGGVSGACSYTGGKYYNNGAESPTGCTVSVSGVATFEFS